MADSALGKLCRGSTSELLTCSSTPMAVFLGCGSKCLIDIYMISSHRLARSPSSETGRQRAATHGSSLAKLDCEPAGNQVRIPWAPRDQAGLKLDLGSLPDLLKNCCQRWDTYLAKYNMELEGNCLSRGPHLGSMFLADKHSPFGVLTMAMGFWVVQEAKDRPGHEQLICIIVYYSWGDDLGHTPQSASTS